MSELLEYFGQSTGHPGHPDVLATFNRANVAFPQMFGGMILRTGRVAMDLMIAGDLTPADFANSTVGKEQVCTLSEAAVIAHKHANVDVPFVQNPSFDEMHDGIVTPMTLRHLYWRTKTGVANTMHQFGIAALGIPEEAPVELEDERLFINSLLMEPQNKAAAELLQTMWQTADDAVTGRPAAEITTTLHRQLRSLPENQYERRATIARACRAARTALNSLIVPALAELKPHATETLGDQLAAVDAISAFPLMAIYEGGDELTDDQLELIRTGNVDL